ncbi:MAG: Ppx/GppA family phosphatase [Chlorobiaceae bacterium]|nr:Ppx/GppA family phosphatase [Chlorobiaceae bacterium]NTV60737.1 Ppx/GppA family phosphatase [Chlorobiaceae bacterium]
MKRVACIDIGTNTALLLIADLEPENGTIIPLCHRQTIVRLGKNVDAEKTIEPMAIERLVDCLGEYGSISREHGCETIIAAGTSALRDAANRDEVISEAEAKTGITIKCISGTEEAELTFFGAVAGMNDVHDPFTVLDIGGGSTEISMGSLCGVRKSVSLDIGSVRLTERFFTSLPPSWNESEAATRTINDALAAGITPFFASRTTVYGVAGTLTSIAQLAQGLKQFDALKVHNYALTYLQVHSILETLKKNTLQEITGSGVPEGRADVITMGTLILHQFMRMLGIPEIRVSIQGLRFGLAQRELHRLRESI